jgi:hypothetical protein
VLFTQKDNDCNLDYALFSLLSLSVLATYIIHPQGKFRFLVSVPSPLPAAGFLRVSFLLAQVKGQVIPRLLAAVTDTKLSKF